MPLEARHPLEPALHHELRDAFNRQLQNTNFFIWIDVRPTGDQDSFVDLNRLVREIESWLAGLAPDAVRGPDHLPETWIHDPAAAVKLRAIPKKREARGYRSDQIVGNPEPILLGWQ
jgi:hypothetical protein